MRANPAVEYRAEMPSRNATTTPRPPPFGVAFVCAFRSAGRSITPADIIATTTTADTSASTPHRSRWRRNARTVMDAD